MLSRDYNTLKQFWNLKGLGLVSLVTSQNLEGFLASHTVKEILSHREYFVWKNKPTEKRKSEWLLGRVASKLLAQQYLSKIRQASLKEIEFSTNPRIKPIFRSGSDLTALDISISHTTDLTVVALGLNERIKAGIDIEQTREVKEGTYKYFLTGWEIKQLNQFKDKNRGSTIFWTFKEAVLKSLGIGLKGSLKGVEINFENDNISVDISKSNLELANRKKPRKIHTFYQSIDSYHLATVLLEN